MDYEYNIRGLLRRINNYADNDGDMFRLALYYDEVNTNINNDPLYNGNISAVYWTRPIGPGFMNEYFYDGLNRLKKSSYYSSANNYTNTGEKETNHSYDKNGNITSLNRMGVYSPIDNLNYYYTGNKLTMVVDNMYDPTGFNDG